MLRGERKDNFNIGVANTIGARRRDSGSNFTHFFKKNVGQIYAFARLGEEAELLGADCVIHVENDTAAKSRDVELVNLLLRHFIVGSLRKRYEAL